MIAWCDPGVEQWQAQNQSLTTTAMGVLENQRSAGVFALWIQGRTAHDLISGKGLWKIYAFFGRSLHDPDFPLTILGIDNSDTKNQKHDVRVPTRCHSGPSSIPIRGPGRRGTRPIPIPKPNWIKAARQAYQNYKGAETLVVTNTLKTHYLFLEKKEEHGGKRLFQ